MTIKQNGGVFGRNPTLNDVTIEGTTIFDKDGSTVGSIGTISSDLYIAHDSTGTDSGLRFRNGIIQPCSATGGSNDASVSLGQASMRFSNLFVSSGVYFGTATSATHLDDYEEGTWTGTLIGDTTAPTSPVTATGTYTKIARQVIVQISFDAVNTTGASGAMRVNGLPFTAGARGFGPTMKNNMGVQVLTSFTASGQDSVTFSTSDTMTTFNIGAASSIYLRFALMYSV